MKFNLDTDINNLAYLLYMDQMENTDSNEDQEITWNRSEPPQGKKENRDGEIL